MIKHYTGDIFTTTQPAMAHGCNTHGIMGSGIAKIIKDKFPEIYPPYAAACAAGTFNVGDVLPTQTKSGFWIMNIASQDAPGANARLDWLETSLDNAYRYLEDNKIKGIALPRIGAGIGGLEWKDVIKVMEKLDASHPDVLTEVWSL